MKSILPEPLNSGSELTIQRHLIRLKVMYKSVVIIETREYDVNNDEDQKAFRRSYIHLSVHLSDQPEYILRAEKRIELVREMDLDQIVALFNVLASTST